MRTAFTGALASTVNGLDCFTALFFGSLFWLSFLARFFGSLFRRLFLCFITFWSLFEKTGVAYPQPPNSVPFWNLGQQY
jgi:hypothetical protein